MFFQLLGPRLRVEKNMVSIESLQFEMKSLTQMTPHTSIMQSKPEIE